MQIAVKMTVVAATLAAGSVMAASSTSAGQGGTTRMDAGKASATLLAREGISGGNRQRRSGTA